MVIRRNPDSHQHSLDMETTMGNAFPQFADGDVHITITGTHRYKLHSATLRRVSPIFRELLDEQPTKKPTKKGAFIRYRLMLVETDDDDEHPYSTGDSDTLYALKLVNNEGYRDAAINDPHEELYSKAWVQAWEKCLGAFYGKGIHVGDTDENDLEDIIENAVEIVKVATYLDCMDSVAKPVESGLLNLGQQLFLSISNQPVAWLGFACQIQSKSIWREAVTHTVGQFNKHGIQDSLRTVGIPHKASDIVHEKAFKLKEMAKKLQSELLSYYPDNLQRTKTTGRADRDSIGRASYANDIMAWLGLTCWRHWLGQMVILDHTHNAEDMGWQYFKCVYDAGDSYLNRVQMDQFHLYFPMSGKGQSVLENNINMLKQRGRNIVEPALRSYCQLDIDRFPVNHMTCVRVGPSDFPWMQEEQVEEEEDDDEMDGTTVNEDVDVPPFDDIDGTSMDDIDDTPMDEDEDEEQPFAQEVRSRGMEHPQPKEVASRRIATLGGQDIGGHFDKYGGYVYPDDEELH